MFGPFAAYARPYWWRIFLGLVGIAVAQAAAARIPVVLGQAIDAIDLKAALELRPTLLGTIRWDAFQIVALAAFAALCNHAMRRLLGTASTHLEYDIRTAYFAHLLTLPLSFYQQQRTGDLMSRATNDLNAVRVFFTYGLRSLVEAVLIFAFSVAMMCTLNWHLALIVLLPMPVFSVLLVRMASLVHSRFRLIQEHFGQLSTFLQENLAGIRVVKTYVQGPFQAAAFERLNQAYLEKNQQLIGTHAVYHPMSALIAAVGLGLILWFGGRAVIAGQLSPGEFVAFNAYLTMLIRPVSFLGWVIDRLQRSLVAMRRIDEIMEVRPEIRDRQTAAAPRPPIAGHIRFHRLSFSYGDAPVLRNVDLDIPAGTTLGIVGRVGSGKTSLARLIPRLTEAGAGQVSIDGLPVEQWPLEELRRAIGYVSQVPFLFSDTVAANVAYGVPEAGRDRVLAAAQEAQLAGDVAEFEEGFDTVVGERGVTLSGGQKQRATLARALLCRPRILILDDALSAVDTHTEEAILGHLRQLMQGRTTILIAHRLSTLRDADHIVVLDEGCIAEQGRHEELLAQGGMYADTFRRQQLAAELEAL